MDRSAEAETTGENLELQRYPFPAIGEFEGDLGEVEAFECGGDVFLGSDKNALIFSDSARSYSSIKLQRSSSEVMETSASMSSVGN